MRGLTGYAVLTHQDGGIKEWDTFTCAHCKFPRRVPPRASRAESPHRCRVCDELICVACASTQRCEPFDEKWKRAEARAAARRSYGL